MEYYKRNWRGVRYAHQQCNLQTRTKPIIEAMASLPKDYFVASLQYTKNVFQDVYPAIDPSKPTNSLAGRIAIVTGASRGIGARVCHPQLSREYKKAD